MYESFGMMAVYVIICMVHLRELENVLPFFSGEEAAERDSKKACSYTIHSYIIY